MLLQLCNILGGLLLEAAFIKNQMMSTQVDAFFAKVAPYETIFGLALTLLGVLALVQRLGFVSLISGASFPQAAPLILVGLILGGPLINRYLPLAPLTSTLGHYRVWIGLIGIVCGFGSLLFGCMYPVCFSL